VSEKKGGRRAARGRIVVTADFTISGRQVMRTAKILGGLVVATLLILLRGSALLP
jgi:hypothetical protein